MKHIMRECCLMSIYITIFYQAAFLAGFDPEIQGTTKALANLLYQIVSVKDNILQPADEKIEITFFKSTHIFKHIVGQCLLYTV